MRQNDGPRFTWYSVDVEASGPVPGIHNLLSIGVTAIVADEAGNHRLGDELYLELQPVFPGHVESANAVHGLDLDRLRREGLSPCEAMRRLAEFVERTRGPGTEAVFVGHVAVFDWMHFACYLAWCGIENPFGYKGIDTKSLAMGVLGVPWDGTGREEIEDRLGIPHQDPGTVHRADADARQQARVFLGLLEALEQRD